MPLGTFVNDATYGLDKKIEEDFLPQFWQQDLLGDQRLGIPAFRDIDFLLYNQTWAKEMGFQSAPTTTAQFMTQSCKAAAELLLDNNRENDGTGGWIINRNEYVLLSWLRGFNVADFPQQESSYAFDQAQTLVTFKYLRKMYDDNCAWLSLNPTPYDYFSERQALFISADLNDLQPQSSSMDSVGNADQWLVLPYPSQNGNPVIIPQGSSYAVMRSSKAQELASWLFIRWMNDPQQQEALAKENKDFPASQALLKTFSGERGEKWAAAAKLLANVQPAPRTSEWRVARFVLPDAFLQVIQSLDEPVDIAGIIEILDETIANLSAQPAASGW
jgi:ABC-type glycerol-3-phosphate transport system substrate-binding protein